MKVKFNVKGVEVRAGGGEPIPKGVYRCTIDSCDVTEPQGKDQRIEVVYVVADGDYKGRKLFDYINLVSEAAAFKVREFLEATGVVTDKKEAGEFDPAKMVGKDVMIRVSHQTGQAGTQWEGQVQSRVGSTMPLSADADEDEDLDDEDEDEDEDEGEDEQIDLDELDRSELKALIKEHGVDFRVLKKHTDDDLRAAIKEALSGDEDEDEGEDEDEDEDEDYSSMSVEELRTTLKERGLSDKGSAKVMKARLEKDDEASKDGTEPF